MLWITGMALTACILMITALLGVVVWFGLATFWPKPIDRVTLNDGTVFLGNQIQQGAYDPGVDRLDELREQAASGELPEGVLTEDGRPIRRLYRVGNKEVTNQPYHWVDLLDIESVEEPTDAALFERMQWGVWLGVPEEILLKEEKTAPADSQIETEGSRDTAWGSKRFTREIIEMTDTEVRFIERTFLAVTTADAWALLPEMQRQAEHRRSKIESLRKHEVGGVNGKLERARLQLRKVEILHERGKASEDRLAQQRLNFEQQQGELQEEYEGYLQQISELDRADDVYRVIVRDVGSGEFAPRSQSEPDEPMRLSQIVRIVRANDLSFMQRVGVYTSRWWEYLSTDPREANTEGGVFPVIFGTVMMTILLSIIVVPLGVIAALYMREYAKQGLVISVVRIAINNLAGVPSIVYGVFGLGFFCYTVGGFIDNGPAHPWRVGAWWLAGGGTLLVLLGAVVIGFAARPTPGQPPTWRSRLLGWLAAALWLATLAMVVGLVVGAPYFGGLFPARTTFGTKGVLWSSLTLALLTLPVVIVATEEAISAVPGSMRQGSYGCGASKWQTIRRIVLPSAAPGIMTGMILAIARGAGEVAPLMLVGAVKLAPKLPFEAHWPFLHLERSFMHLGFHIYDVGFQSPDSQAARPMVWTTTLLLIVVVVMLNLAAISLRARLRRRLRGGAF